LCLEDAIKHARARQTFGKRLIDHPVRHALLGHRMGSADCRMYMY